MDRLLQAAEAVLCQHADPALRLSELLRLVRRHVGAFAPDADALRRTLETRPDRFRLLDPWRGPWRSVARDASYPLGGDPWVVVVGDPGDAGMAVDEPRAQRRLRSSLQWLAARMDTASRQGLSRWYAMVLAAETLRGRLTPARRQERAA